MVILKVVYNKYYRTNMQKHDDIQNEEISDTKTFKHLEISKVTNLIYLGSCEHPLEHSEDFQKLGINVIINCAREISYTPEMESKYIIENFPLDDDPYASLLEYIDVINDTIHKYVIGKKKIYIHCVRGMSRSPAIVIYYLMSHKNCTYRKAFKYIRKIRPVIDINPNFTRELLAIEEF